MSYQLKSIKSWAEDDRPREKLLANGHRVLSDSELLAIILRNGSKDETAVDLAKQILASVDNNWNDLSRLTVKDLCKFKGVGLVKAVTIITALEIGRRRAVQDLGEKPIIRSSKHTFELMKELGDLSVEEFWVLFLNQKNAVTRKERISIGGIAQTIVDVRVILKTALEEMASGLILIHNHPSGNLKPSHSDLMLTKKIQRACASLDFQVLDHVIITQKSYYSFADSGDL